MHSKLNWSIEIECLLTYEIISIAIFFLRTTSPLYVGDVLALASAKVPFPKTKTYVTIHRSYFVWCVILRLHLHFNWRYFCLWIVLNLTQKFATSIFCENWQNIRDEDMRLLGQKVWELRAFIYCTSKFLGSNIFNLAYSNERTLPHNRGLFSAIKININLFYGIVNSKLTIKFQEEWTLILFCTSNSANFKTAIIKLNKTVSISIPSLQCLLLSCIV